MPDVVFDLWTDIDADKVLFASDTQSTVDVECDLRVGGRLKLTIKRPDGPPILESNLFTRIDRPRRLEFRSTLMTPDEYTIDRDVEVTFDDLDGGTSMTVVQKGFPTAELRDLVGDGVSVMLDRLEGLLP
jgi:uncharacterized protein YndB with AHSA1/START domain